MIRCQNSRPSRLVFESGSTLAKTGSGKEKYRAACGCGDMSDADGTREAEEPVDVEDDVDGAFFLTARPHYSL